QEAAEVEELIKNHPEVKAEIRAIETALEEYAFDNAIKTPFGLQDKIWDRIREEEGGDNKELGIKSLSFEEESHETTMKVSFWNNYLRIAASLLLLLSILGNIYLFSQWKNTQKELVLALTDNNSLAQQAKFSNDNLREIENILSNPDVQAVKMNSTSPDGSAYGLACWNKKTNQVYLFKPNLPTIPSEKEYQLWALVDGKPVSAGMIDMNKTAQSFTNIANVQAFAISLEPKGGSPQPTTTPITLGKLS
ncbi:MAG: anti-sigma factor, partial [Spirosomaceae bacterium]|nr:anti-sigma factor [Spirosomataceae bacterium]